MTKLGYQIPNFNYPDVERADLFESVAAAAGAAEAAGADTVFVMDHFYQLPMLGPPENWMLECYTLLAGVAARTERIRLGALVTGNTYRNPAFLAKTVTTLDLVSGGRALLGIGAGWYELEHTGYGYEFGTFTDRFEKLEEALQLIKPMLRGERPTFEGRHYRVKDALNEPAPLGQVPVMIGGAGEKKTLRMVAQYADESNMICTPDEIPRKLEVLAGHCETAGRDPSEIAVSWLGSFVVGRTMEEAQGVRDAFLGLRGLQYDLLPEEVQAEIDGRLFLGDPDTVGERVQNELLGRGLPGLVINLPGNGLNPEAVTLAVETMAPLFS